MGFPTFNLYLFIFNLFLHKNSLACFLQILFISLLVSEKALRLKNRKINDIKKLFID